MRQSAKLLTLGLCVAALCCNAGAQNFPQPFALHSHSALDTAMYFQYELTDSLFFDPAASYQLFYRDSGGSWQSTTMGLLYAACSTMTIQGSINYFPPSGSLEYYFRGATDTIVVSQSPKNSANTFPAPLTLMADLGADPVGDTVNAAGQWLDITGLSMSYSDTRIYARLTNAGGGFPTSTGLTFHLYSVGIIDPDATDSAAYAMIYVNVPFVFSSGLYKINLTDSSFTKIANISTNISGNALSMACNISDLLAQPGWSTWPPPSGCILTAPATLSQGLSGSPAFNDAGSGAVFVPKSQTINYGGNTPPVLNNPQFNQTPGQLGVTVQYSDAEGDEAVERSFTIIGHDSTLMQACEKTYSTGALFIGSLAFDTTGWYQYTFLFSDGVDTVQTPPTPIFLQSFIPGDADGSGAVSIADAVFLINYIFAAGPAPVPIDAGDADCSGAISIADAVFLITYIFAGGPAPQPC